MNLGRNIMPKKPVVYDFFSIDYDNYERFKQALQNDVTPLLKKWVKHKSQNIRIESWEYKIEDNIYLGLASKLNLRELPLKGDLSTDDLKELGLSNSEGTASVTAFVVIPEYRTLILQRNHVGVRAGSFLNLLCTLTKIPDLELSIMLDQDALRRMNRMKKITSFTYKMANPSGVNLNIYNDKSVKEAAALAGHYQSQMVKVELSVGRLQTNKSMVPEKIKRSVKSLLKLKNENESLVHSIVIKGKESDDEKLEPLDLIKRRLNHDVKIELVNRILPPEELRNAAWQSYVVKKEEVKNYKPL